MTQVNRIQSLGVQPAFGNIAPPKFDAPVSSSRFAGQILATAPAADTVQFSAKAPAAAPEQASKPAALIQAAAAFAGASLSAPSNTTTANTKGPSKAELFFGRSDSGSGLSLNQKVTGSGASDMGGDSPQP